MTSLELLICGILIFVSAYMAASEVALFSLSRFQLRALKEHFKWGHRKVKRLLSDPSGLLITLLVTNEVVNISLSVLITNVVSRYEKGLTAEFPFVPAWAFDTVIGLLITTPIILFVCEITPKVIAARTNQLIAALTATPVTFIYDLFKPIRLSLKRLVGLFARWAENPNERSADSANGKHAPGEKEKILKESDFLLMIEEGHREGAIQEGELELIRNVFELDDTTVADVFTPMARVLALPAETSVKNALQAIRTQRYSRIPIIRGSRKRVTGVLYAKDLLKAKLEAELLDVKIEALTHKPFVVAPTLRLNSLFRKFKQQKTHMAVVQNQGGEATGIVTMTDVLEALFADFPGDEDFDDLVEEESATRKA